MFGENDGDFNNIKAENFHAVANQEILFKKLFNKDKRLQISVKKKKKDYHLIHGVEDVVVDVLLCVNGKGVI